MSKSNLDIYTILHYLFCINTITNSLFVYQEIVGNFVFCKAAKSDFYKLYLQMDKLSKKDCFKRFKRVFAKNLGIQTRLQRYKAKKTQENNITKFQRCKITFNLFRCFTGLSEFLIRKLANNYKIRSFKTGNKILIDYDSLMAFLQSQEYDLPMEQIVVR